MQDFVYRTRMHEAIVSQIAQDAAPLLFREPWKDRLCLGVLGLRKVCCYAGKSARELFPSLMFQKPPPSLILSRSLSISGLSRGLLEFWGWRVRHRSMNGCLRFWVWVLSLGFGAEGSTRKGIRR